MPPWKGFGGGFIVWGVANGAIDKDQARGRIGATAAGLHQSHRNTGAEPRPIPQLSTMLDPQPTERGEGSNPHPYRY